MIRCTLETGGILEKIYLRTPPISVRVSVIDESGKMPKQLFVFEREASRLELFIRIIYSIAIAIVIWLYSIFAAICLIIQWFIILILGHRNEDLSNFIKGYLEYYVHVQSYVSLMTDKRPGIMPKSVKIFEEE